MAERVPVRPFRSRDWFADPLRADTTALYLERFMNYGMTPAELQDGRSLVSRKPAATCPPATASTSSLPSGCATGSGMPAESRIEFPVHPIFENCRRPTTALDRNLAYLSLVEILYGYPIDAVVLTTGCDKTTPSQIMAASTVGRCDALVDESEIARRRSEAPPEIPESHTPWEELYREKTRQLAEVPCWRWP